MHRPEPEPETDLPLQRTAARAAALLLTGTLFAMPLGSEAGDADCLALNNGAVEADVATVTVTPSFQLNGNPFPVDPANAARISLVKDGLFQAFLGDTDQPPQPVHVIADTYDLLYQHKSGSLVPRNAQDFFARNVPVTADGILIVNVPSVSQAGPFILNGAAFPASDFEDANIFAVGVLDGNEVLFGNTHDGSYSLSILPGEYDIVYRIESGGSVVPRNSNAVIDRRLIVANNFSAAVSVQSAAVSGSFTFNGSLAPNSPYENGEISLRGSPGDVVVLGQTRDQSYSTLVVQGEYDVHYDVLVSNGTAPLNQNKRLLQGVALNGGTLDVDVPSKTVVGDFTRNGLPAPPSVYESARISFVDRQTRAVNVVGVTSDQSYSTRLIPGSYDVLYERLAASVDMPLNVNADLGRVSFTPGGLIQVEIDIDVPRTFITVASTLDAAPWPGPGPSSGELSLWNLDDGLSVVLGLTHDLPISIPVVSGSYRFGYAHVGAGGAMLPVNSLMRLPDPAEVSGANAAFNVAFESTLVQPALTLNGSAWPMVANQSGRLFFTSESDVIELSPTSQPGQTRVLQGTYDLRYAHDEGNLVPVNFLKTIACFRPGCLFCDGFE